MIIFTGVAGSGKSLQGRMLADDFGLPWLSTGEFLRMLVGGERRKEMLSGKLLEDKEIIQLVRKIFALIDTSEEFVLDGFPRTVQQADWLISQSKHQQVHLTAIIHLKADEETVLKRLTERGRQDDNEEAIRERFREYENSIKPILEDFKKHGVSVIDIDASGDVKSVHQEIKSKLQSV